MLSGQTSYAQTVSLLAEDEVVVTGRYLYSDQVNALKTPTPIIDVPQSLSILTSAQIEQQAFSTISDITRFVPGINTSQGEGHRDAIIIRGNQSTADFYQDGLRDDVQYFRPLYNVQQLEILRGSNALLFGRGGIGGIINRVTKKGIIDEVFTNVAASVDTFGAFNLQGDTNFNLNERAALRLNGFYEHLNNHRDFFDGNRFGINPTVKFEVSPQTTLNLSYEYLDDDRVVDRGVPSVESGDVDMPLEGFDNTFFGSPDQNFTVLQAHILRGQLNHEFNETFKGNITVQYADYDKAYQNLFASERVNLNGNGVIDQVELDGYRDTTERQNILFQGNLIGEFDVLGFEHTLLVGADYSLQDTSNARIDNVFAQNGDDQLFFAFSDPLNIPAFSFTNPARDRQSDINVLSIYVQDQIDLTDQFKLLLGGRFDSFKTDIINNDSGTGDVFKRRDEEFSPRLGAIYKPADSVSIYASFSETFLPRSGDQFLVLGTSSSETAPQRTENLEAGVKWDIKPSLSVTTSIFDLDRSGVVTLNPVDQALLDVVDGVSVKGFEAQLTGDLTDQLSINIGYSYLDGEVEDLSIGGTASNPVGGNNRNAPRQTPEHTLSIWSDYQVRDSFGLGAGATYQDNYFVREDNSVEIPSYIRFDAAAYVDVSEAIRVQVNIENLFDTNYFPDAHSNTNISTGSPLNARFTVLGKF